MDETLFTMRKRLRSRENRGVAQCSFLLQENKESSLVIFDSNRTGLDRAGKLNGLTDGAISRCPPDQKAALHDGNPDVTGIAVGKRQSDDDGFDPVP